MDNAYYNRIRPSKHSSKRIKQRAGGKTKKKRSKFVHGVYTKGLMLKDIPKRIELLPFIDYMRKRNAIVKSKNPFHRLYLYKDNFVIVSLTGTMVTVLNIDKEFKGSYDLIYQYIND